MAEKEAPIARPEQARPGPTAPAPRLKERYMHEVLPTLMRELEIDNPMRAPRLEKIVVNMGVGEAIRDAKLLEAAAADLATISGQKPAITKAPTWK